MMGQVHTEWSGAIEMIEGKPRMPADAADRTLLRRAPPLWRAAGEARCWCLVVIKGTEPGTRLRIGEQALVIGRNGPADLVLDDSEVSPRHCSLVAQPFTGLVVTDHDAANGTYVNDEQVHGSVALPEDAELRVGRHVFRCERISVAEAARLDSLADEVRRARDYVQALLPAPIGQGPLKVDWAFAPSAKLGGDAFGYRWLDDQRFAVFLIDVSGHGPGAALHSATITKVLRSGSLPGVNFSVPVEVVGALNDTFPMTAYGGMCFSIWYGVYDRCSGHFDYCSAGHPPAYLIDWEAAGVLSLQTRNLLVGALPGYRFRSESVAVPMGSRVVLFSDGAFEIRDAQGREGRLEDFRVQLLVPGTSPEARPAALLERARQRVPARALEDDFTVVSIDFCCVF